MRNPRININDEIWRSARQRAIGENKTTSQVVEDALGQYLQARNVSTSQGSATPDFTGNVAVTHTGGEAQIASVESKKDPIVNFRPAPKPGTKKAPLGRKDKDQW